MALKRQNDRQELLDARDAERFSMDKERFATNRRLVLLNYRTHRLMQLMQLLIEKRALGIQKKNDDFEVNLAGF